MSTPRKALIGLSYEEQRPLASRIFQRRGYEPIVAGSFEELRAHAADAGVYAILMDINYSHPGTGDISSGREIYEMVKPRVEQGYAKFLGIAGSPDAVENARRLGIPCEEKSNLFEAINRNF